MIWKGSHGATSALNTLVCGRSKQWWAQLRSRCVWNTRRNSRNADDPCQQSKKMGWTSCLRLDPPWILTLGVWWSCLQDSKGSRMETQSLPVWLPDPPQCSGLSSQQCSQTVTGPGWPEVHTQTQNYLKMTLSLATVLVMLHFSRLLCKSCICVMLTHLLPLTENEDCNLHWKQILLKLISPFWI